MPKCPTCGKEVYFGKYNRQFTTKTGFGIFSCYLKFDSAGRTDVRSHECMHFITWLRQLYLLFFAVSVSSSSLFVQLISFVYVNDCSFERFNYTENNDMVPIPVVSRQTTGSLFGGVAIFDFLVPDSNQVRYLQKEILEQLI